MSLLVSMLTLVPGSMGGSETYARELLRELEGAELEVSTLVSPVASGFSGELPELVAEGVTVGASARGRVLGMAQAMSHRGDLRRQIAHASVVHFPFTVPLPTVSAGQRSVVTLLDVQHHDLPHLFSRAERVYRSVAYDRAARRADCVITISNFSKGQIVRHLGIDPDRVVVAPLGARLPVAVAEEVRQPFLLYPAKGWPHKNHRRLLQAFELLRRDMPELRLVLTGVTAAELPALPDGVEVRGIVDRAELTRLYAAAAALVFPSLYEGFGLPIVEAMAQGCPVAASTAGALPEVVGDAGVLFDPYDPVDIARGVRDAISSSGLTERGHRRVRAMSWSDCAKTHGDVFRSLGA